MPQMFRQEGKVLRLKKSLYGLRQSPLNFFLRLKTTLEARGLEQSPNDPCLFIGSDVICVCWVDDCLFFSKSEKSIDRIIASIDDEKASDRLQLNIEDSVAGFLGIDLHRNTDGSIELKQIGLTERILRVMGLEDCKADKTPCETTPLGADKDGAPCEESWSFASVVGMMMYLASNSRPDIAYAVHQCARFSHNPRHSHEVALKRIARYLKGTATRGMKINPNGKLQLDCYVDADFAGLFAGEDARDPTCARSRTGYVITLGDTPVLWTSKLQSKTALSTTEAEISALSMAMRDFIPLRRVAFGLFDALGLDDERVCTVSKVWEDNNACITICKDQSKRYSPRTRHYAAELYWFLEHIEEDGIEICRVDTSAQRADIYTKGLGPQEFPPKRKMIMGW